MSSVSIDLSPSAHYARTFLLHMPNKPQEKGLARYTMLDALGPTTKPFMFGLSVLWKLLLHRQEIGLAELLFRRRFTQAPLDTHCMLDR